MSYKILIIDDEQSILSTLKGALEDEEYLVDTATSGASGVEKSEKLNPDVILLDIWMEGMDGLEALKLIKKQNPNQVVIMMSGHGTVETAVRATKEGAYDFIEKPLSLEKLLVIIQNACQTQDLARENEVLREQVNREHLLIGKSDTIEEIRELIEQVAPTTGSILITGENGTGKEVVAHSIHNVSPRSAKPFIAVNCAAIPDDLIESELFGHEKGAFTGATQQRKGKFDLAHNGTLFLDEIGDMSLKTQAKILRILQEQKFQRVGGSQNISVDVRIIAATNKDLHEEIREGRFREDLFYRLNVVPFQLPPLRSRKEDIALLAAHFLQMAAQSYGKKERPLSQEATLMLQSYTWPGNVRELKNLMERVMILTRKSQDGEAVSPQDLRKHLLADRVSGSDSSETEAKEGVSIETPETWNLREARMQFERNFILKALDENNGNISRTADALGIERSYLHRKIKAFEELTSEESES